MKTSLETQRNILEAATMLLITASCLYRAAAAGPDRILYVVSPPLRSIENLSVAVSIPGGWTVGQLDMTDWRRHTRSGDFILVPITAKRGARTASHYAIDVSIG